MNMSLGELDVEIIESTADNEDSFGGRWGWYWCEIHNPPRGPFADPAAAVFDFAEWVQRRFVDPPLQPVGDAALAQVFLRNAEGFLKGADLDPASEVALASCCYALELILNGYLLSRGFSDKWNAEHIRHDLAKAYQLATHHGLPDDDARIDHFIREVAAAFATHGLMDLHARKPGLVARYDALVAVQALHREAERRLAWGGLETVTREAGDEIPSPALVDHQ